MIDHCIGKDFVGVNELSRLLECSLKTVHRIIYRLVTMQYSFKTVKIETNETPKSKGATFVSIRINI